MHIPLIFLQKESRCVPEGLRLIRTLWGKYIQICNLAASADIHVIMLNVPEPTKLPGYRDMGISAGYTCIRDGHTWIIEHVVNLLPKRVRLTLFKMRLQNGIG